MAAPTPAKGVEILDVVTPAYSEILTPEAMQFLAALARKFESTRVERLAARVKVQAQIDAGALPDFPPETADIRAKEWTVAPIPKDLEDRRVEITGPVERKMVINALNSGANVFMADFEDSNSPTWQNNIEGQINLRDAIARDHRVHQSRGQEVRAGGKDGDASGAPARLASDRTALPGGWQADVGRRCSISASTSSTMRRR